MDWPQPQYVLIDLKLQFCHVSLCTAQCANKGRKRSRGAYSRLICIGCRERRIRCELPSGVEVPEPGELTTAETPCYRCKRLGIPCKIRQTVLGRPSPDGKPEPASDAVHAHVGNNVSRVIIELPSRSAVVHSHTSSLPDEQNTTENSTISRFFSIDSSQRSAIGQKNIRHWNWQAQLHHTPLSTEAVIIVQSLDIIRFQRVEREWFRHLPARVGNTQALDLSCKAMVAACFYARGEARFTRDDCYRALALALNAVRRNFDHSPEKLDDNMLASTALLAHLEATIHKHGIPTRLHVHGLAAILAARPPGYPVTRLARQILDFHICDSAIMACIQGTASPFENVPRSYYANDKEGSSGSGQAQFKALGSELFIRIPRLVGLVRSQRIHRHSLADAFTLLESLLALQDYETEVRILQNVTVSSSTCPGSSSPLLRRSSEFASVDDFEALTYYWQNRLMLLRLENRLQYLCATNDTQASVVENSDSRDLVTPTPSPRENEVRSLVKNIVMSIEYFARLPLRKHQRLSAHATLAVWGACTDWPLAFGNVQNSEDTNPLSELLLRRVNVGLAGKPDAVVEEMKNALGVADMHTAAEMFVGGPLEGKFIELYCRAS
ncbi:unnamed protein product [Periconia digitata]|uniref:Zn(2)-C6 fungal-type domain-containing protein n=1 Tax=Periconia digitata TaxID=1303443 RepID=A0A9W4XPN6_9PLEO|nr:unnamed protein product [Periconia digitata]